MPYSRHLTIVDIDHCHPVRAGIDHGQECRNPVKTCTIAHRCRNCNDRFIHPSRQERLLMRPPFLPPQQCSLHFGSHPDLPASCVSHRLRYHRYVPHNFQNTLLSVPLLCYENICCSRTAYHVFPICGLSLFSILMIREVSFVKLSVETVPWLQNTAPVDALVPNTSPVFPIKSVKSLKNAPSTFPHSKSLRHVRS